ncbi:MAG: glycine cleavage system protein GcvH [Gammaproteobacteria bacterium]
MEIPGHLKYTSSHEWIAEEDDEVVIVGITDYAQSQLGDVVYIEHPKVGQIFKMGQEAGVVESVKAASDIYAPLTGEVIEVNEDILKAPEGLNQDPYHSAWLFKMKIQEPSELLELLDADSYQELLEEA